MQKWRSWEPASEADWSIAVEREAVIRVLAAEAKLTRTQLEEAMLRLQLSRSALYKFVQRYRRRPRTSSLLQWKRGRDRNARLLEKDQEDLLQVCVEEFYLTRERPSVAALMREVKRRFCEHEWAAPAYRTVQKRVRALDPRLVLTKREGPKRAWEKLGPVFVSTLQADLPMDVIQIDHTQADVIVVDREHRRAIGRPWLSLAIDIASRAVVGFSVSLEAPSSLSVSLVLSHLASPKQTWLADRELHNLEWPMGGLPKVIHVDNAQEFHSKALLRGCQEYGITLEHREPGRPHLGGHIERLIGTMMGEVHLLPGSTSSNPLLKGDYEAEARAILSVPELERWLALQIAGVYHLTPHSALHKTPLAAWQEGIAQRKQPLRYPLDAEEFFLDFLPAVPRKIQRDGIHFHNIRYWHSTLSPWAGRLKKPLWVKYDPRNLARIYVQGPEGRHWPIPYADLRQPSIALWELLEAQKRMRDQGKSQLHEQAVFANVLQQRRLIDEASNRSRERRRRERTPEQSRTARFAKQPRAEKVGAEEIQPYRVEIWENE
jgi:putative transposase